MEPLKNIYNKKSVTQLAKYIARYTKNFNSSKFLKMALSNIDNLEMKARVIQISNSLAVCLSKDYLKNLEVINELLVKEAELEGFILWPISQYIEDKGQNESLYVKQSLATISILSPKFTGEFVMREYINKYPKETLSFLIKWSKSKDHHLRRLASESTRLNLPWGKSLNIDQPKDPRFIFILENLKFDDSEYVRRSVANSINDLSHIDPRFVTNLLKKWAVQKVCSKLIRHALRTLLKKGNSDALKILGYNPDIKISLSNFKLTPTKIKEGEKLELSFRFKIPNSKEKAENTIIEYVIGYPKSNGTYSRKVFRLSDSIIKKSEVKEIKKVIHFKKVTTRTHYLGLYFLEIQINGIIVKTINFELKA